MSGDGPRPALVIVLGPTGSGKSALAHAIALSRGGEIVSADAFAVYRGFDVGTAKPTRQEREEVPYHLIDVADPAETYSAGRWAREARAAIETIRRRGKLPIVCGGSGFYVSALLEGLPPGKATEPDLRARLKAWGEAHPETARRLLKLNDPVSEERIARGNLRYVLRALEILLATGAAVSARSRDPNANGWLERWRVVKLGLAPPVEDLYARIEERVRRMLDGGWNTEVRHLLECHIPMESNAFQAIGYREVADWVEGRAGQAETEQRIVAATRRLAKRQKTWLKRERGIEWMRPEDALEKALERLDRLETGRNG